jgi:hypothetical protein
MKVKDLEALERPSVADIGKSVAEDLKKAVKKGEVAAKEAIKRMSKKK